ncbi:hypothetical protein K438DRAFT_1764080 [Mycena galopus ATCC 62051]|nr:hypothetical protein K438DRAFT_1764080 [Mycena galopus ATCC 62051]
MASLQDNHGQDPPLKTHGGQRAGSGRKSKEWHAEQAQIKAQEARQARTVDARDDPPIQSLPYPLMPSSTTLQNQLPPPRTAAFFHPRSDPQGVALQGQGRARGFSHPNHGLQVGSDQQMPSGHSSGNSESGSHISAPVFQQLVQAFNFLDLNDPNRDLAPSDNVIEDNLFDAPAEDQPNDEADAAAAAEETAKGEPPITSIQHTYLQNAKKRILREIAKHGQPLCYEKGYLWDRPKDPLFAMQDALLNADFTPDSLYYLDIFLWFPRSLAPNVVLKCECSNTLVLNGFNDNIVARRVRRCPTDYFLLTNRLRCNSNRVNHPGCGKSYQGTDVHILAQLPRMVQLAFPAYLSTRSAIDKQVMVEVVNLFSSRVGPAPYAELYSESQRRAHAERELIWLAAAEHHGFTDLPPFSSFDDRLGYGGSSMSVKYIRAMFVDWFSAHRIFMDRCMAANSGLKLANDHTFWVVEHTGKLKGESVHTALHSVVNEWEEVRSTILCLTKSMTFVEGTHQGIEQGLKEHGHKPTQVVYSDQPQVERSFHEKLMPSLREGVEHVTIYSGLPPLELSKDLPIEFARDSHSIQALCSEILEAAASNPSGHFLLAVSTKSNGCNSVAAKLHIIQFRTSKTVYILQVTAFQRPTDVVSCLHSVLTS